MLKQPFIRKLYRRMVFTAIRVKIKLAQIIFVQRIPIIELMETAIDNYNDLQTTVNSYEPPTIEILEITVEKGFADSTTDWGSGAW